MKEKSTRHYGFGEGQPSMKRFARKGKSKSQPGRGEAVPSGRRWSDTKQKCKANVNWVVMQQKEKRRLKRSGGP